MTLIADIRLLRDRIVGDLSVAHDYFADTSLAWRIVHEVIQAGYTLAVQNTATGTVTTHAGLASKARGYVAAQLAEATFQNFILIVENNFSTFFGCGCWRIREACSARKCI